MLIFLIAIFYQWQAPLMLTKIKLQIQAWSIQLFI